MEVTFFFLKLPANEGQCLDSSFFAFIQSSPTCQSRVYVSSVQWAIEKQVVVSRSNKGSVRVDTEMEFWVIIWHITRYWLSLKGFKTVTVSWKIKNILYVSIPSTFFVLQSWFFVSFKKILLGSFSRTLSIYAVGNEILLLPPNPLQFS